MASQDEINRYENALNAINMCLSIGTPAILDGWDAAAGMTRREKIKEDLQVIARCDDPRIRSRARDYLGRL